MTREQAIAEAREAADKARRSAEHVDHAVAGGDSQGSIPRLSAAGALWADTARAYAAIAAALPETPEG
jgi:NaMN:DMB phosphoribosyltransferase